MDNNAWWYAGGRWVHPNEATLSVNDIAVLRGYSVFESMRTYDRRPFHLEEHLLRLYRSAVLIELDIPWSRQYIADVVLPSGKPTLVVLITPLGERDMEQFARGYWLITTGLQRVSPEAKTANYVAAVRALKEAERRGAADALFVNEQGHVLEGTRSNFFIFRSDTLVTPREGILIGVTRNVVLELARGRFAIEERPILLDELALAGEAFITSSSREITPVVRIDDLMIGDGKPGPRTYELEQRFIEMVERGNHPE